MLRSGGMSSEKAPTLKGTGQIASATTAPTTAPEVLAAAREMLPWLVEIRRDFHQHPELGLEEHRTSARVQALLDELGIEHEDGIGGTGVLGLIRGSGDGAVALRADLDALPHHRGIITSSAGVMPQFAEPDTIKAVADWVHDYPIRV